MSSEYKPLYVKLSNDTSNILDSDANCEISSSLCMPRCDYGFHHWVHQNKNKASVLDKFEGKKKVYHIMNEFEIIVDDHDESIYNSSVKYFTSINNADKEDTSFHNMWEIINFCELIDTHKDAKNFTSLCVSKPDLTTYLSVIEYRKKYASTDKDKYVVVGESSSKIKSEATFVKSVPTTGEFNLIIMDQSVKVHPENILEQTAQPIIFKEIYEALNVQKTGGNFVCKFYEIFTQPTVKMLSLLTSAYKDVSIIKPLTSRLANNEIFVVCKNFIWNDKERTKYLSKLKNILESYKSLKEKTFVVDIFTDHHIDWEFKLSLIVFNNIISNEKIKNMDQIKTYINGSNYHGDIYRVNRTKQINATKYWNELFLSPSSENKKNIAELLKNGQLYSEDKLKEYRKILINTDDKKEDKKEEKKDNKKEEKKSNKKSSNKTKKKTKD